MTRLIYFLTFLIGLTVVMNLSKFEGEMPKNERFNFSKKAEKNMAKKMEIESLLHPVVEKKVEKVEAPVVLVELSTPQLQSGSALYKKCMVCHGNRGQGKAGQKAPSIGGQHDWYLETQIANMRDGKRINKAMNPYVKKLSDQDIKDLAHYISKLPYMGQK